VKCEDTKTDGSPCRANALRDSDPPRCRLHALSAEERNGQAQKAAKASGFARRSKAEPRARSGIPPAVSLADILGVCTPALSATFEHGPPDWGARLAAVGTIVATFPRYLRDTPENVRALIEEFLPSSLPEGTRERLALENVYVAMRAEWDALRVRHHPVTGLYSESYPPHLIAPWEDAKALQAAQPKPEGDLRRTDDGALLLYREGESFPLLVPEGY
jgi:hypothetical protein